MASMAIEGVSITVPEPTAVDAYSQLFKNLTQMGMIVLLLVFGGMLSNEIARGTLLNMLTKGLSRHAVILAKYTVALLLWTAALTSPPSPPTATPSIYLAMESLTICSLP
ncbi:MAG: hypothetical protein IPL28_23205 [Chloroflexi bacterium]|nr:hypothetical protein [Chloroflexota bacterium]